jgi:hypothetical protein
VADQIRVYHRELWLAQTHHRTHEGHRFDLINFPYLRQPLDDQAQVIAVKKSTQGGWTEMLIIKVLALVFRGLSVFWVFPTDMLKNRFVKNRFDRSVAYTLYYQERMRTEESQTSRFNPAASMSLKHFARGSVALVGSNSVAGFGEFPADAGVVDEYDNCDQANLAMVEERLSASEHRIRWLVGNPTISGKGISALYEQSTQGRWLVHADCGHWLAPEWKRHVVREVDPMTYEVRDDDWEGPQGPDARLICDQCGKPVNRYAEGEWDLRKPETAVHGYHVNKLFSTHMTVNEMLERFNKGLVDPEMAQRFWNGDMGEAYTAPGAHITREDLQGIVGTHAQGATTGGPLFVGIDVGAMLHIAIGEDTREGAMKVVWLGAHPIQTPRELRDFIRARFADYKGGVIDMLPETRFSRRLAMSSRRWLMCQYGGGKREAVDLKSRVVTVDRTSCLDALAEAVRMGPTRLVLPGDALAVDGFVDHMQALTRVFDPEAKGGEGAYVWSGDAADHYMHALGYMFLARRMLIRR